MTQRSDVQGGDDGREPPASRARRIVLGEAPALFTLSDDEHPGHHVLLVSHDDEEIEIVATLDALVVVAYNVLALVADERAR